MDRHKFKYYDLLVHAFVAILLISNLVGSKICAIGPFRIGGAQILFPLTYIFGDIFTEVYGYGASRRAIWIAFGASALLSVIGVTIVALPPAPDWPHQQAFATVFYQVPRMIVASLIAFWAGEFSNAFVLAKMKLLTGGRHLWTRTIASTAAGQLIDSLVFLTLAFGGVVPVATIFNMIFSAYLGKVLYEAAATPVTYLVVNKLKRAEGVDVFDYSTKFNPFAADRASSKEA